MPNVSDKKYAEWLDITIALYFKAGYTSRKIAEMFDTPSLADTIKGIARRYRQENPDCPYVQEWLKTPRQGRRQ